MSCTLEGSKLATAAWLARTWRTAPLRLKLCLVVMVLALMVIRTIGAYGFRVRAHVARFASEDEAIEATAAPVRERILVAEAAVNDLDARIRQLDAMIASATAHDRATRAMSLLADQSKTRAALIEKRQLAAERLGTLRVEMGGIDARRARLVAEAGLASYLAKLFDSDGDAAVRAVIALIVGIIDPLAVLLVLAVSRGRP